MEGVASVDVQNGLNNENNKLGIRKNVNQQTVSALERTKTISDEEIKKVVNSKKNTDKTPPTQDDSNTSKIGGSDSNDQDQDRDGTRSKFGLKELKYPISLSKTQDTLKIDMLKYKAKEMNPGGTSFGAGDRHRTIKEIIGTVVLPIPGGIRDADRVEWGSDSMTAIQMGAAGVAYKAIEDGVTGAQGALNDVGNKMAASMRQGGGLIEDAVTAKFTAAAVGKDFSKLMSRTQGQVMNPNMELLFSGPTLRPFSFNFLLAPRSKDEAKEVMKIIRFFKQGMAPIRSKSNLFLRSPHTFQLTYRNGEQNHKYLNSFKECALTNCEINYTPEQTYSTYEDGVMTAYTMALSFKELEPVFNDDYGNAGNDLPSNLNFESEQTSRIPGTTDYNPKSGYIPGQGPGDDKGILPITNKPWDTSKGGSFF
jgi:hypothetical protein